MDWPKLVLLSGIGGAISQTMPVSIPDDMIIHHRTTPEAERVVRQNEVSFMTLQNMPTSLFVTKMELSSKLYARIIVDLAVNSIARVIQVQLPVVLLSDEGKKIK